MSPSACFLDPRSAPQAQATPTYWWEPHAKCTWTCRRRWLTAGHGARRIDRRAGRRMSDSLSRRNSDRPAADRATSGKKGARSLWRCPQVGCWRLRAVVVGAGRVVDCCCSDRRYALTPHNAGMLRRVRKWRPRSRRRRSTSSFQMRLTTKISSPLYHTTSLSHRA